MCLFLNLALTARGIIITSGPLLRLLQLSSAALPVGGYAFSQGLEYAVDCGWVNNAAEAKSWLHTQARFSLTTVDLALLIRSYQAAENGDQEKLAGCNSLLLACRETRELRLTDTAMGEALLRVLKNLQAPAVNFSATEYSFVAVFACAACHWKIDLESALLGYGWSWLENQVSAATKLIPLGQTQAQQMISDLQPSLQQAVAAAQQVQDDEIGATLPALAIASSLHETQYTRLFRS